MNARGVTGIIDPLPGLPPLMSLYLQCETGDLLLRVGYRIPVQPEAKGHEAQWFSNLMAFARRVPMTGNWLFLASGKPGGRNE